MENSEIKEAPEVQYELEGDSYTENMLRAVVKSYRDAFNRNNPKNEIDFTVTVTTHKVATPDGNKDCAYLRIDRHIREKQLTPTPVTEAVHNHDDGWSTKLLHQEVYFFKNMRERVDPKKPWKEQLFLNALVRLTSAGLEYAELLQKLKNVEQAKKEAGLIPNEEEQRLEKIGLVGAKEMPKPLTQGDQKYKEWLAAERAKEGL